MGSIRKRRQFKKKKRKASRYICMLPTTCQWQREEVAATRTGWNWRANAALGRNSKQILMRRTKTPTYLQTWTSWGHNTMSAIRVTGNIHLLKNQSHLTSGNNTYRHTQNSKVQPCVGQLSPLTSHGGSQTEHYCSPHNSEIFSNEGPPFSRIEWQLL